MMGKIDLNDSQHYEKIVMYFKQIIENHESALIENKSKKDLIMIEVQTGEYLEEDDIKRFNDIYKR